MYWIHTCVTISLTNYPVIGSPLWVFWNQNFTMYILMRCLLKKFQERPWIPCRCMVRSRNPQDTVHLDRSYCVVIKLYTRVHINLQKPTKVTIQEYRHASMSTRAFEPIFCSFLSNRPTGDMSYHINLTTGNCTRQCFYTKP